MDAPVLHAVIMTIPADRIPAGGREAVAAQSRWARAALAHSAALSGFALGALRKGDRGQPLPSGGVCWSLAHTANVAAAVVAPNPVGIDVEKTGPFTPALLERVAGRDEWQLAPTVDELVFCRYWTAKEAVLKATGAGLSGLDRCHVVEIVDARSLRLSFDAAIWTVSHVAAGAAHLAAVTVAPDAVVWHTLEWRDV